MFVYQATLEAYLASLFTCTTRNPIIHTLCSTIPTQPLSCYTPFPTQSADCYDADYPNPLAPTSGVSHRSGLSWHDRDRGSLGRAVPPRSCSIHRNVCDAMCQLSCNLSGKTLHSTARCDSRHEGTGSLTSHSMCITLLAIFDPTRCDAARHSCKCGLHSRSRFTAEVESQPTIHQCLRH